MTTSASVSAPAVRKTKKPKLPPIEEDRWCELPDLVLENIFSYLNAEQKYYASLVCSAWYQGFHLPYAWSTFVFQDTTLTRRKFNYYSGWQYILDHIRTQQCLSAIGMHIRVLIFTPMTNFYNLYEFMNMVSYYAEHQGRDHMTVKGVGSLIHTLKYTFPCNMSAREEQRNRRLYGTGGKLLEALKRLMGNLESLRHLELIDLMLDHREALSLLDQVCYDHTLTLRRLSLVNCTKITCPLLHAGVFLNLQVLEISPQNLGEDVVYLLGEIRLQHLHIIQNRYTPLDITAVSSKSWKQCAKNNPSLKVHLRVECIRERHLLWQESAPVHTVLYVSPQCKLLTDILTRAMDLYKDQLCVFGHIKLPRFHQPKSFNDRMDPFLLMMCRVCPNLHTLVVRERVSTSTVLLLANEGKKLRYLYIRRNAVILRCDWPHNPEWSPGFYEWLRMASRSYEDTEREVSQKFGRAWHMLSDKEFTRLSAAQLTASVH
ncbi:F-box/LRR-repeat protein 21-like [Homalodisca vitripennis]|uniref:F-box/LRR-repeat protein 21-like n=1 Tax=Homalodisca vitripennis TaxID=197043 RepID=UPI001EECDF94|nr:F-box/LRR-repeat protein 21-like [Homalodisca vitripennis]